MLSQAAEFGKERTEEPVQLQTTAFVLAPRGGIARHWVNP